MIRPWWSESDDPVSERGTTAILAVLLIAATLMGGIVLGGGLVFRRGTQLLNMMSGDAESQLYCDQDLSLLVRNGPTTLMGGHIASKEASTYPCLPRRIDYDAPGMRRAQLPLAACELWHYRRLRGIATNWSGERLCD